MHQHPNSTARTHPPALHAVQKMTNNRAILVWREFFERTSVATFLSQEIHKRAKRSPSTHVPQGNAVEFARNALGFDPDLQQAEVLASKSKRGILNCTRQWGKSTVAAIKALYTAHSRPGALVLVASPGERQSAEFLHKTEELVRRLGIKPRGDGKNSCSLLLPNQSRIIGLPGTEGTVRGFSSVSLLLIDEAARVPDALYVALRPTLAVGDGHLWMMSTPDGKSGFFYESWADGGPQWHRVSVPATECARIPKTFLEEELRAMGSSSYGREYMCEFADDRLQMFDRDLVRAALRDVEPLRF
jgi:hypothetical protein